MATFSLLLNFDDYIRNLAKILVNFGNYANISAMPKFSKVFFHQSEQALSITYKKGLAVLYEFSGKVNLKHHFKPHGAS